MPDLNSGREVHLVEMPLQELGVRPVDTSGRSSDRLTGVLVILFAVVEVRAEAWAHQQPMLRINPDVSPVEQSVYVGPE